MKYTPEEVMQFVQEEDVKFIRLAFCDVKRHWRLRGLPLYDASVSFFFFSERMKHYDDCTGKLRKLGF